MTDELEKSLETMDDYADELEASFKKIREGDILTGTVIGVSETEITLDLKYYTDGIIKLEDYTSDRRRRSHSPVRQGGQRSACLG